MRKFISILFALVLVLSFSLIPAMPAAANGAPETIEVSQPIQVTSNSYYERGQSIVYDGANYWLFYGRSASCTSWYQGGGDPDVYDYALYYKKASTVAGLASATASAVTCDTVSPTDTFMGETSAVYYDGKVWVFASIPSPTYSDRNAVYGWYSTDGSSWTSVGPFWDNKLRGSLHHDEVIFDDDLWVVEGAADGDFRTRHGDPYDPTTAAWDSSQLNVGEGSGGLVHFFVDNGQLYLGALRSGTPRANVIYRYDADSNVWIKVDECASTGWDPTLFKVGSTYVFAQAPWVDEGGGRQYTIAWSGNTLNDTFFDRTGDPVSVTEGRYGSNTWTDMWPIGFTDQGGNSYLFFTSERNPNDPSSEITGNIWYLPVDWTITNAHYTYIQEAIDAASSGDTINVAAGTYNENLIINKSVNLLGPNAGINPNTETRVAEAVISMETVPGGDNLGIVNIVAGAGNTVFDGFEVRTETPSGTVRGIEINGADSVAVKNIKVHHTNDVLVYPNNAHFLLIENCEIYDSSDEAIKVSSELPSPHDCNDVTIRGCTIHDARGIWVYSGSRWTIENNTIHDVEFGINVDSGGSHIVRNNLIYAFETAGIKAEKTSTIVNNTITYATGGDSDYDGSGIAVKSGFTGGIIKDNIIASCKKGIYLRDGAPTVAIDYNDVWNNPLGNYVNGFTAGAHDISVDPQFVGESNYHLQSPVGSYHAGAWTADPNDSPCIDAGDPTSDYSNEPYYNGGRINMGAYGNTEQASKSPPPPPEVWVDDEYTAATPGWGVTHFDKIQDGIDAVAEGGTVNVANGTYSATTSNSTEDPSNPGWWWFVTIDKSLNLIGESRDGVILDGSQLYNEYRSAGIWVSASDVTVKNLTIQNFYVIDPEHYSYGLVSWEKFRNFNTSGEVLTLSYVTAENLKVVDCQASLYFMMTEHAIVKDCIVEGSRADGIWVAMGSSYATVQGNIVTNSGDHGIWVGGASWCPPVNCPNATIINNTINGAREGGISFVNSDGATISGNTITNVAGESPPAGWSVGALSLKDGCSNVEAFDNTIYNNDGSWDGHNGTGNGVGIDGTPSSINLHDNNIYGNTGYGCHNDTGVAVDAENNWWGDATGPKDAVLNPCASGDEVSDSVDYSPWLDAASPGGTERSYNVQNVTKSTTHNCIQEAIDAADPGDTINVAAGTYSEHIAITTSNLALVGEDKETTIIDARQDSSWDYPKPGILINGVSGVTVSGFTIRDAAIDENGDPFTPDFGWGPQARTAILIYATSSDHVIENNILINNYWGVFVCAEGSATTECRNNRVANNIIRDSGQDGVYLYTDGVVAVENTQIVNNEMDNLYGEYASGVEFWAWPETEPKNLAITGTVITGNDITSCTYGVRIRDDVSDITGTSVNFNNFIGNTNYGIYNGVASTIDATNNWWGTKAGGLIKGMVSGSVEYDPWIGAKAKDSKSKKTAEGDDTVSAKDKTDTDVVKKGKGKPTITVTEYTDNPGDGAPGGFSSVGKYIDVHIDDPEDVDEIEIRNYYTEADITGLDEATLRLSWWNGTIWEECSHSGVNTADTDGYSGYVWAIIRETGTIPTLDDMAGTPFMSIGIPPAAPAPAGGGGGGGGAPPVTVSPVGAIGLSPYLDWQGKTTIEIRLSSADGLVSIAIPLGTLVLDAEGNPLGSMETTILAAPPPAPEDCNVIGLVYDFGPDGATFEPGTTMTFSYDPAALPDGVSEEGLVLSYWDGDKWVILPTTVDTAANTATATVAHFTPFATLAYTGLAEFAASDLSITPAEVESGESVTISLLVANTGDLAGSYKVTLKISGVEEAITEVALAAGASEGVSFTTAKNVAGTYEVTVGGLSGTFVVKEAAPAPAPPAPAPPAPAPTPPAKGTNWWLIGGIIAGCIIIGVVSWQVVRRRY